MKTAAAGSNKGMSSTAYRFFKVFSVLLKEMTFGKFVEKNLHLTKQYITAADLEKEPPQADIYVTGSDQTWNSQYNGGVDRGFFLTFAPKDKAKVSFVASFGKSHLNDKEVAETKPLIAEYKKLSVREDSALDVLHQLGRDDGVQLIDPTLQLTKDEWLRLASPRLVKQPYLILMLLYNEDKPRISCSRKSTVFLMNNLYSRIPICITITNNTRTIRRTVIHQNDFTSISELVKNAIYAFIYIFFNLVNWYNK